MNFKCLLALTLSSFASFAFAGEESSRESTLGLESAYLATLSVVPMALLWTLPPEQSQWYDKPELTSNALYLRWRANISRGPVWDGDMRFFNSYGHIHSGAAYAMICLNNGLDALACTAYASVVSLSWEYGPEAIIEVPSYQDILMTGLVGARVGLEFYRWQQSLKRSGGTLLGSRVLGAVAGFALNPFGKITRGLVETFHGKAVQSVGMPTWQLRGADRPATVGYTWRVTF